MPSVALYARYSSDLQNPQSIDDQFRLCHEFAERQVDSILGPEEEREAREQGLVKTLDDRERSCADAETYAERLRVTTIDLPQAIRRNGQEEDIDRLSGGMREQLSVLTRLAFARLLARDGRPAPVILDDALVYSDDDRIEKMFDALHRQSRDQQIIVFSCRQPAFQRLGGNVLQMTDWQP